MHEHARAQRPENAAAPTSHPPPRPARGYRTARAQAFVNQRRPLAPDLEASMQTLGSAASRSNQEAAPARSDFDLDRLAARARAEEKPRSTLSPSEVAVRPRRDSFS